mgnify:CR=1 FL=1
MTLVRVAGDVARARYHAAMQSKGMLFRWQGIQGEALARSEDEAALLAKELGVEPIVAMLLHRRGLSKADRAKPFLHPKLTDLHDPALMPGLALAAMRMHKAVQDKQPIVVYGDYDVDGVAASAILWHILRQAGAEVHTYIPHRIDEGYGLNAEALLSLGKEHARDGKPPLIISVDCGITAIEPAKAAAAAGIELIITDHHEFDPANLPGAVAVVHPRISKSSKFKVQSSQLQNHEPNKLQTDSATSNSELETQTCTYPFPELCGAGVAFKLAWQFAKVHCGSERVPAAFRDLLLDLLSIAALGTVADIVPLVDENRVITTFGLGQIKRTRFIGLNAMIDSTKLRKENIDAFHVGFVLGPRLNACGRMGHASDALKLLTTVTAQEAPALAEFLTAENDRRRETEKTIAAQARQMVLDQNLNHPDNRAIVLGCEDWHPGVIGIVCSRLVDEFHRPTILLNFADGQAHGSGRSVAGVSIHEALEHCSDLLKTFGGHAMAAGMRMERDQFDAFRAKFSGFIHAKLSAEDLMPMLRIDADCALPQVTLLMVEQVQTLAPFGRDNPSPVLCVRDVVLAECARRIGSGGAHLRLQLKQDRTLMQAVGWRMGELAEQLPAGVRVDVVFEPKVNSWDGRRRPDMHIKDIRIVR